MVLRFDFKEPTASVAAFLRNVIDKVRAIATWWMKSCLHEYQPIMEHMIQNAAGDFPANIVGVGKLKNYCEKNFNITVYAAEMLGSGSKYVIDKHVANTGDANEEPPEGDFDVLSKIEVDFPVAISSPLVKTCVHMENNLAKASDMSTLMATLTVHAESVVRLRRYAHGEQECTVLSQCLLARESGFEATAAAAIARGVQLVKDQLQSLSNASTVEELKVGEMIDNDTPLDSKKLAKLHKSQASKALLKADTAASKMHADFSAAMEGLKVNVTIGQLCDVKNTIKDAVKEAETMHTATTTAANQRIADLAAIQAAFVPVKSKDERQSLIDSALKKAESLKVTLSPKMQLMLQNGGSEALTATP